VGKDESGQWVFSYRNPRNSYKGTYPIGTMHEHLSGMPYFIDATPLLATHLERVDTIEITRIFDDLFSHFPFNAYGRPIIASTIVNGERITVAYNVAFPAVKPVHCYGVDTMSMDNGELMTYRGGGLGGSCSQLPAPHPTAEATPQVLHALFQQIESKINTLGKDSPVYTSGFIRGLITKTRALYDSSGDSLGVNVAILSLLPDWIGLMTRYIESGASVATHDACEQFEQFALCALVCSQVLDVARPASGGVIDTRAALNAEIRSYLDLPVGTQAQVAISNFSMSIWHQILHRCLGMYRSLEPHQRVTFMMPEHTYFELKPRTWPRGIRVTNSGPANIMMVFFAPNNVAASDSRFDIERCKQNISDQLAEHRQSRISQPVTLIVDTSTQPIFPVALQTILHYFSDSIRDKQLIVIQMASMAKLLQFGLDRASGGLMITYSSSTSDPVGRVPVTDRLITSLHHPDKQPPPISDLAVQYFLFLLTYCKDDLARYHADIVRHTNEVYDRLWQLSTQRMWTIVPKDPSVPVIGWKIRRECVPQHISVEVLTKLVWKYIMYQLRHTSIDIRQSFGFLDTHLTCCGTALRFVIGARASDSDKQAIATVLSALCIPPISNSHFWSDFRFRFGTQPLRWDSIDCSQFPPGMSFEAFLAFL